MKKIVFQFILIYTTLFLLFKYNLLIRNNIEYIFFSYIKNILPSMFPLIFISNYIKYNILNKSNSKIIRFLALSLSFAPSNAVISSNNKELIFSTNINPLFSYVVLSKYFNNITSLKIIIINLIINYILLYKNIDHNIYNNENKNISDLLNITIKIIINIFGIIIFYNIIISILSIIISKNLLILLEITNGYNIIKDINNYNLKLLISIFLNSFCGIALYTQINSIKKINYIIIINKLILSILITLITYIIIMV